MSTHYTISTRQLSNRCGNFKVCSKKEKYSDVLTIAFSKVFVNKRYLAHDHERWCEFQHVKGIQVCFAHASNSLV